MASLLEKFKFTPKAKSTLELSKSSADSQTSDLQDSEVTCIPETPSSMSSKMLEASPVFPMAGRKSEKKADSSENSPTFSTDAKSKAEGGVRRDILSINKGGVTEKLQDLQGDTKDSDETYVTGLSNSIHSNGTAVPSEVNSDEEWHLEDDETDKRVSPIFLDKRKAHSGKEENGLERETCVPSSPKRGSGKDSSSDSEIESAVIRRRKKRALSPPWNEKTDENGCHQDEDSETDKDEGDIDKREKPLKRRRVEISRSTSVDEAVQSIEDSQMKQLTEMFPNHSQKHLKKTLEESDGSLDIAVSLLVETPSPQAHCTASLTNDSPKVDQLEGSKNERSGRQKSKKGRARRHRISSSEEEGHGDCSASDGQESEAELPDPFANTGSPHGSPRGVDTDRKKPSFTRNLSKFAYNGGLVSKENQQDGAAKRKDKGEKKTKPKTVTQTKKKPTRRKKKRFLSSEEEEDEEDCGFVVDGSDSDDGHMNGIGQSEDEEEEEEEDAISSDDGEEYQDGGNAFSESFRTEVVEFFNTASKEELEVLNGCSRTKAQRIMQLRPFEDFSEVLEKMEATSTLGVHLVENCEDLFSERQLLLEVLNDCCSTSQKIQDALAEDDRLLASDKKISLIDQSLSLKPYQLVGVNWMKLLHRHKINGILADEMGLGKTIQVIAFLASLMEEGKTGPHLIVAPSSTLENWLREFNKWCPSMEAILYTGDRDYRMQLADDIRQGALECNVLITSYNMAISEVDYKRLFKKLKLQYSVYDEGHMLKNVKSLRYKNLMKIKSQQKLLLTGTPLQNNLLELMSLICFVVPNLDSQEKTLTLQRVFSNISSADESSFVQDRIQQAKKIMEPFVLRRVKDEVLAQLPKKVIQVEVCPMVPSQQTFYQELKASFQTNRVVEKQAGTASGKNTMSALMELRKLANHPLLMRREFTNEKLKEMSALMLREPTHREADPLLIEEDMGVMSDFELHLLCKQYASISHFRLEESAILESGKFKALDKILPRLKEQGLKVLLFSQFVMMLDIVEPYMKQCKHKYLRMDGSTSVGERGEIMDKFINDPDIFVFLLSTKACGLGINLTIANTVILYDIDYNPHNDKQAEDRCHRVGQTRDVTVIKLVSKGTIDETMLQRAQQKLLLEKQMTTEGYDGEDEKVSIANLLKEALEFS